MGSGRTGSALRPEVVAEATLTALRRRSPTALPGQTRLLPTLLRLAPRTTARAVSRM